MPRKTAKKSQTNHSAGTRSKRAANSRSRQSVRGAAAKAVGSTATAMRSSANVVRSSLRGKRSASSEASRITGSTVEAVAGPLESAAKAVVGGTVGAVAGAIAGVSDAVKQANGKRKATGRD